MALPNDSNVPVGNTGKFLRTFEETVNSKLVQVEALSIADPTDVDAVGKVTNAAPADDAYGLVTRIAGTVTLAANPTIDIGVVDQGAAGTEAWLTKTQPHSRDTNNEQTTPLLAAGVFDGAYTKVDDIEHFEILYAATTPFTATKIWSNDGVTPLGGVFGTSTLAQQVVSGYNVVYDLNEGRNIAPYYKLHIVNGATPQTAFPGFISITWLIKTPYTGSYGLLSADLNNLSRALLTRSVLAGTKVDGTFGNAGLDNAGNLEVSLRQSLDTGNTVTRTSADGATQFVGAWSQTRSLSIVRELVVIASTVTSGLGGTFVFEYSEDGITATISESRTIGDFATVRDFDLINAGEYFRVKFTPSRALTGGELVFITTTLRRQNDGPFVRLANQELEEANSALGSQFTFIKAFDPVTGKSVNIRPTTSQALRVSVDNLYSTPSGSVFVESIRDDVGHDFGVDTVAAEIAKLNSFSTGTGSVTADTTNGGAVFATGATANSKALFLSEKFVSYEPGHGIGGEETIILSALPTGNAFVEWGWCGADTLSGFGDGVDSGGIYVWLRKNVTPGNFGSYTYKVYQSSWNRDKCDGQIPSLFKFNGTAQNLSPLKDNLYRHVIELLYAKGPRYEISPPSEEPFIRRHVGEYANQFTSTSLDSGQLYVHVNLSNGTSGQNLSIRSGSWRGGIFTSKTLLTGKNPDGDFVDTQVQGTDSGNVTTTPLIAGGTYRGTWFNWQKNYVKLVTDLRADVAGTLYIDLSEAATQPSNVDDSGVDESIVFAYDPSISVLHRRHTPIQSRWYRLRYINGIAAQASMVIDAALVVTDPGSAVQQLAQMPTSQLMAETSRVVPALLNAAQTAYQEQPTDTLIGAPFVHVNHVDVPIGIKPLTSGNTSQVVCGTAAATRLDVTPLTNRKSVMFSNMEKDVVSGSTVTYGNVAVWGHDPLLMETTGFDLPVQLPFSLLADPSLPFYVRAKSTGAGTTNTQVLTGTTSSGTATTPANAKVVDTIYSNITAAAQTVDIAGYSITPTLTTLQNIYLRITGKKLAGQFQTVAFQDVQIGNSTALGTVTSASVTGGTSQFYLVAIGREVAAATTGTVSSVAGLGLSWTQVGSTQNSDDDKRRIDVWRAYGNASAGTVLATFATVPTSARIAVHRYTGADPTTPVQASNGIAAASATVTGPALAGTNLGYSFLAAAINNATSTPGAGYTERSDDGGTTGTTNNMMTETKALVSTGSETATATLNASKHYAAFGVTILPAAAIDPVCTVSYKLSGVTGATTALATFTSSTPSSVDFEITSDRVWTFADIPNVDGILTGTTIGNASADIDSIQLVIVETSNATVRVCLHQGAHADG